MNSLILLSCLLQLTFALPQIPFVTFRNGNVGVNFAGYNAEAGLGGLLTGDSAHGGLSASAGTPWGPRAAAGLGGQVNGRAAGVAYAGAEANPSVGASAVLGGVDSRSGFAGSEAHANGHTVSKTVNKSKVVASEQTEDNNIQVVNVPKKHLLVADLPPATRTVVKSKHKTVHKYAGPGPVVVTDYPTQQTNIEHNVRVRGNVENALQIPIGILRSLQESLSGFQFDKSVSTHHN